MEIFDAFINIIQYYNMYPYLEACRVLTKVSKYDR